jgi:outer membrane biosynthesis protein TonB
MPDQPAFVRTSEKQTSSETPDETDLIGERNTTATSDEGAVVGDEKMTALAGEMEKNDVKTFNSNFSDGESAGPKEGLEEAMDTGKGEAEVNEEAMAATDPQPESFEEPLPEMEEDLPKPKKDPLVSIDAALAILEEAIGDEKKEDLKKPSEKIEETMPEKPAENQQEASNQDGGFTPKTRKTRVAGVLSADGEGSLNVADTPAGRYQANLLKKLETEWQMENIRNRSLLAPGNVTLYFIVDQKGKVSRQKRVAMVGASGTQWGMILRALNEVRPPSMPKAVINDLDGDVLELIVTFNY